MERAELQQISQMRELYHQKIAQIEEQISKLDQVIQEHETTNRSLKQLIKGDVKEGLIPIGAGIQIPIQYSNVNSTLIDIGSGIQAEKTRDEALEILSTRNQELLRLMDSLKSEFDETEKLVIELATQFNDGVAELQDESPETTEVTSSEESESRPKRRRRKRGTEFTLDD